MTCLAPIWGSPSHTVEDTGYRSRCWLWQGALNSKGYAVRGTKDERYLVHRRAYEEQIGEIPDGHELHHLCRKRHCVNPKHLRPLTTLGHRRTESAPLVAVILEALKSGPLRLRELRWVAVDAGFSLGAVGAVLHRLAKRSEIVKPERGLYALASSGLGPQADAGLPRPPVSARSLGRESSSPDFHERRRNGEAVSTDKEKGSS